MPKKYVSIPNEELRKLCIEKGWCDNADNSQYEKIFYANENAGYFTLDMLSVMIWVCTDKGYEDEFYDALLDAKTEYYKKYFRISDDENCGFRIYSDYDTIHESENFRNIARCINDNVYGDDFTLEHTILITDCFGRVLWEKH